MLMTTPPHPPRRIDTRVLSGILYTDIWSSGLMGWVHDYISISPLCIDSLSSSQSTDGERG